MSASRPKIASLQPVVLEDNRRVILEMMVAGLPNSLSNVMFMPDLSESPPTRAPKPDPDGPSPYPNVELSILNRQREKIVNLLIVEHSEARTALTLHIPSPDPQEQYIARAEMTHNDEILDVVEIPFTLNQGN